MEHPVEVNTGELQWSPLTPAEERRLKLAQMISCRSALLGILLVVAAFIFGYLSGCDTMQVVCVSPATRDVFRVLAVAFFIFGFAVILIALYTNKRVHALKRRQTRTLISTVTRLGLMKSPTPAASLTRVYNPTDDNVDDFCPNSIDAQVTSDLPEYDVVVNVVPNGLSTSASSPNNQASRSFNETATGAPSIEEIDQGPPPPNYEEALRLAMTQQSPGEGAESGENSRL